MRSKQRRWRTIALAIAAALWVWTALAAVLDHHGGVNWLSLVFYGSVTGGAVAYLVDRRRKNAKRAPGTRASAGR